MFYQDLTDVKCSAKEVFEKTCGENSAKYERNILHTGENSIAKEGEVRQITDTDRHKEHANNSLCFSDIQQQCNSSHQCSPEKITQTYLTCLHHLTQARQT